MRRSNFGRAAALIAAYAVALQALLVAFALPVERNPALTAMCSTAGANAAQPAGGDHAWPCGSPCTMPGCLAATGPERGFGIALSHIGSHAAEAVTHHPIRARPAALGPQIPRAPPTA